MHCGIRFHLQADRVWKYNETDERHDCIRIPRKRQPTNNIKHSCWRFSRFQMSLTIEISSRWRKDCKAVYREKWEAWAGSSRPAQPSPHRNRKDVLAAAYFALDPLSIKVISFEIPTKSDIKKRIWNNRAWRLSKNLVLYEKNSRWYQSFSRITGSAYEQQLLSRPEECSSQRRFHGLLESEKFVLCLQDIQHVLLHGVM